MVSGLGRVVDSESLLGHATELPECSGLSQRLVRSERNISGKSQYSGDVMPPRPQGLAAVGNSE